MIGSRRITGVLLAISFALIAALPALAEEPRFSAPDISIRIPGMEKFSEAEQVTCGAGIAGDHIDTCFTFPWIGEYIRGLYVFAVFAVTVVAGVVLMIAGFLWLTAGGNSGQVSTAREYVVGAILGLCLMLGSYTILRLINPNLVVFSALNIPIIKTIPLVPFEEAAKQFAVSGSVITNCTVQTLGVDPSNGRVPNIQQYYNEAGQQFGVNPIFLAAMGNAESAFQVGAESPKQAYGLGQIIPTTADFIWNTNRSALTRPAECSGSNNPASGTYTIACKQWFRENPREAIRMQAAYINYIRNVLKGYGDGYQDNLSLIAAGYNAGPGRDALKDGKVPIYPETQAYVQRIKGFNANYCAQSGGTVPPSP